MQPVGVSGRRFSWQVHIIMRWTRSHLRSISHQPCRAHDELLYFLSRQMWHSSKSECRWVFEELCQNSRSQKICILHFIAQTKATAFDCVCPLEGCSIPWRRRWGRRCTHWSPCPASSCWPVTVEQDGLSKVCQITLYFTFIAKKVFFFWHLGCDVSS